VNSIPASAVFSTNRADAVTLAPPSTDAAEETALELPAFSSPSKQPTQTTSSNPNTTAGRIAGNVQFLLSRFLPVRKQLLVRGKFSAAGFGYAGGRLVMRGDCSLRAYRFGGVRMPDGWRGAMLEGPRPRTRPSISVGSVTSNRTRDRKTSRENPCVNRSVTCLEPPANP